MSEHERPEVECPSWNARASDARIAELEALLRQYDYQLGGETDAVKKRFADLRRDTRAALGEQAAREEGRKQERGEIVEWLWNDADLTEQEAVKIVKNTTGNPRKNLAEWDALVALKRGIADAIARNEHREQQDG